MNTMMDSAIAWARNRRTKAAYITICTSMKRDAEFRGSWHGHIAHQVFSHAGGKLTMDESAKVASRLMAHLFDVEKA